MPENQSHSDYVNEWMAQAANGSTPQQLLRLFEQAMDALWRRAFVTLGDVTLMAILDRVMHNVTESFPPFEALEVESMGLDFHKLHDLGEGVLNDSGLANGVQFVIVEFLVVIGVLTAEVLTPALHAELLKVRLNDSSAAAGQEEK